jgi:hypothetical protein
MAPLLLQLHHHLCKLPVIDRKAALFFRVADIVVLTERTEQATAAKENGPGTMTPNQNGLFTKMRSIACNLCTGSGATQANLSRQTINIAAAWTQAAFFQQSPALVNSPVQQT